MNTPKSVFKFFAQTSPGLEKILIEELKGFGLKGRLREDIFHVQFLASYESLFRILHESRTIESLKIQIGPEIKARSEEELEQNIRKLPWSAFLPIEQLHQYNQPQIHGKSYRSNLYHEKLISRIVEKQMNLLMVRKEYKELNNLTGGENIKNKSLNREIRERKKLIEEKKDIIIQNRELQKKDDSSNQLSTIPQLPDIHIYLVKDRANILMKLHFDSLHKHALKEKVGWAPIKEGIVAGSLISMKYKQKFSSELKIWDPFCGSGSIVLELLSMMLEQKIRNKFDFFFLKNFPNQQYQKYLESDVINEINNETLNQTILSLNNDGQNENKNQEQEQENMEELENEQEETGKKTAIKEQNEFLRRGNGNIQIIASDISAQAIQYSLNNFNQSGLEDIINKFINSRKMDITQKQEISEILQNNESIETEMNNNSDISNIDNNTKINNETNQNQTKKQNDNKGDKLNELAPFYIKESFCQDRVRFIRSDFEVLSKLINLKGYTIITNLPYGIRSSEHINDNELTSAFKRFSKVIRKNLQKLQDVYIYTTVHQKYHREHFINISGMVWTIKQKYTLGGLQIGLFELNKEASLTSSHYQVIDEQEIQESEKRLAILQNKLSKENDEISKQLKQIIGDRTEQALMSPKERKEYNVQQEQKQNLQTLRKAASIESSIIKSLDNKVHTSRQIKSIVNRKKVEYAKALRLRSLMQKSTFVESFNKKEIQRRVESKRNRNNVDFIKSVIESTGLEDKEDALQQIQDKLDSSAEKKIEKKQAISKKNENKSRVNRWY